MKVVYRRSIRITLLAILIGVLVVNLDDWRASRQLAIAQLALNARDADRAMIAAREAARLSPANGEAYFVMARAFRRQGNLESVQSCLEKASHLGISKARIRREEWLTMAQSGQMTEAAPHLSELLATPGDDGPEICEAYVSGYVITYQLNMAYRILDAWEKEFPLDSQPHVFRAAIDSKSSAWISAAKHLRKAVELAPQRNDIRLELANTLLALRETDEAAGLFEILLQTQPNDPDVLIGWAQILQRRNQNEQAQLTLDRLLQSAPTNFAALLATARIQISMGRFTEAVPHLRQAVALRTYNSEARYALGTALQQTGETDEARQHFQFVAKAQEANQRLDLLYGNVRSDNKDVASRFEISQVLRDYGEPRDRLLWLRSVVELDPGHKAAHADLAECYAAFGDLDSSHKHGQLADRLVSD